MEKQRVIYTNYIERNNKEYGRAIQELLQRQIKSIEVCAKEE